MKTKETIYPRPLLKRDSFYSLDGQWQLNNESVTVPYPPQSECNSYHGDTEELHYRKEFSLPKGFYSKNDKVILHFGAVDQICDVYLNDVHLGHHEGGYLAFSFEITEYLKEENILKVDCLDKLDYFYPYGKQSKNPSGMWYTPVSGIWQSVWIESIPKDGIDDLIIETDMHSLDLQITSSAKRFTIEFADFKETYETGNIHIEIENGHLWSTEDPYLYDLKISTDTDVITSYFALREINVKEINGHKRLFLNNKPLFISGLLDQGYFEYGIYVPKTPEDYEKDILGIKKAGFNCLRKHIKVEPEAYYYYCDKHGILVMQDMVNSGEYHFFSDTILPTIGLLKLKRGLKDQKRYDFFIQHAKDTIRQLKSHPCIFAYTIYNEGWGQQAASKAYEELKKYDPKRLFDSTSGWFFDDKTDFDSYHVYFRNKVLKGGKNLLLLSECGGFVRDISEHKSDKGSRWGYGTTNSEEELTAKIIEMYDKMVIPSIPDGLIGYIYTQVSDVEGEINGLYTYDRQILKIDGNRIREANMRLAEIYTKECER